MHLALAYLGRESIELETLSAVAKAAGHRVSLIYDPGAFSDNDNVYHNERLARRFSRLDILERQLVADPPDLVLFHVFSNTFPWALSLAGPVRDRLAAPFVFSGIHATLAPAAIMENPLADFVIVGEAEQTLLALLAALGGNGDAAKTLGLYSRDGDRVNFPGPRPPLENLDDLPWPDKELFAGEFNFADDYLIHCGRGCPCACTYCREGTLRRLYGAPYFRRRGIDAILSELEARRRLYGFTRVMIDDPIFFTPKDWTLELLDGYRKRVGVPFRCYGQVKWFDEEIALALKSAGCYGVEFGLQTTNERIRREVLDRDETDEQVQRAFAICERHGLRYDIDHMFGLPGESADDYVQAARLYAGLRYLNRVKVHMLAYFPGAPIVAIARREGIIDAQLQRRIERGEVGDICREPGAATPQTEQFMREWKTFYKVMPIFGRRLALTFIERGWHGRLDRLPFGIEVLLQLLVALRGRDQRFIVYLKYLVFRLRRHRQVRRAAATS
jgi:Radical SAM superfamily/B12 binding domain